MLAVFGVFSCCFVTRLHLLLFPIVRVVEWEEYFQIRLPTSLVFNLVNPILMPVANTDSYASRFKFKFEYFKYKP